MKHEKPKHKMHVVVKRTKLYKLLTESSPPKIITIQAKTHTHTHTPKLSITAE